ncbi:MAG TPA: DUF4349 domain-containing protein [Acidimicrobiales bacterium]|nr:DUF4349 domain-containing protein [Acidimicrobiales bacterium]
MTPDATPYTTVDALEIEIRRALQAEALAVEPPDDLAERTLARALDPAALAPRGRPRARPGRMPLLISLGAAAAAVVAFFVVGTAVTRQGQTSDGPTVGLGEMSSTDAGTAAERSTGAPPPSAALTRPPTGDMTITEPDIGGTVPEPGPSPLTGPRIARTADLAVQVEEGRFDERWRQAEAVAARFGGFVTGSSAQEVEGRLARGNLTLQVPADKLQGALDELRSLGTPMRLNSTANDVSGQIVDYDARLRVAQANEAALLDLARQARSVEDNLAIRPRLQDARREIETLQARRASLQGRVDLATVTASLYEREAAPSNPGAEGRVGQAWGQAVDAAEATLAGMIITAGYLGPFAVLAAAAWALATAVRRRRFI